MTKRVLQLIGSFNQGGSERQALALTRLLKGSPDHEVFLAVLSDEGVLRSDAEAMGFVDVPAFPIRSFFDPSFLIQVRKCARFLRQNRIDIIHTHDFYTNVFGMAAATLAGVKVRIASKRETGRMRTAAQDRVEKIAFGRAHGIVANSLAVKQYLVARGIAESKISVIYNGLDPGRFRVSETETEVFLSEHGLPNGRRFITLVANLRHDVKNVPLLLRSAVTIVDKFPDAHFVIAGEGELRDSLEDMATELGIIENVHFIGRCTDVPALLAVSEICVLTSTAEGFSNSILEYMAAGKPVVATNVGGVSEAIVEGKTGYLIDSDNTEMLVERLLELLDDPVRVADFGTKGRTIVEANFSETAQLNNTIDLYNSLGK